MKILARCRHCHKPRMWVKADDGQIVPVLTVNEEGVASHHPHACSVRSVGCEPREGLGESAGQRMVRDLASSFGASQRGAGMRRKKLPSDMARGLEAFGRKKRTT